MTRMTTPPPVSRMIQASRFRTCSTTRSPTRLRRNRMQPTCPWTTSSICVPASRRRSIHAAQCHRPCRCSAPGGTSDLHAGACRQAGTRRCIPLGLSLVQETVVAADKPRDLFADAAAQAEAEAEIEADAADSADAAATDAEVAAVSTETAARPLEASHDGNKNNLIPVDKLFSARPNHANRRRSARQERHWR